MNTIQKEDIILRQTLEYARLSGNIPNSKIIKVKSESFKRTRRPNFTELKWEKVLETDRYKSSENRL